MSGHGPRLPGVRVILPATSANLGPGFDAVGLALSLTLTVEAQVAAHDRLEATGRDAELCGRIENHLIFNTYREVLAKAGAAVPALHVRLENQIPLGMGCGSSAAALLAGVALANHFGQLGWDGDAIVAEASRREGHPDNVAACWFGGFTISAPDGEQIAAVSFPCDGTWQLVLALPQSGVATKSARAVLPEQITRADAVHNVQRVALLTAAFAQERLDLLRLGMQDRLHQPYRREICGLLEHLEKLHGASEFAGVALSGAGPALLTILSPRATLHAAGARLRRVLGADVELLPVRIAGAAQVEVL